MYGLEVLDWLRTAWEQKTAFLGVEYRPAKSDELNLKGTIYT